MTSYPCERGREKFKPVFLLKSSMALLTVLVQYKAGFKSPKPPASVKKKKHFLFRFSYRDLRSEHVSLLQGNRPGRRLGVVVATVIHSCAGV